MTNHNDLDESWKYFQIKFVEFLDMICRIALDYFEELDKKGIKVPKDIDDKVYALLKILWG